MCPPRRECRCNRAKAITRCLVSKVVRTERVSGQGAGECPRQLVAKVASKTLSQMVHRAVVVATEMTADARQGNFRA
jgi:hypothetical protein